MAQTDAYIARLLEERASDAGRQKKTYIVKDVRMFLKHDSRGLQIMQEAGSRRAEHENGDGGRDYAVHPHPEAMRK